MRFYNSCGAATAILICPNFSCGPIYILVYNSVAGRCHCVLPVCYCDFLLSWTILGTGIYFTAEVLVMSPRFGLPERGMVYSADRA
jgi:hypothetical protein